LDNFPDENRFFGGLHYLYPFTDGESPTRSQDIECRSQGSSRLYRQIIAQIYRSEDFLRRGNQMRPIMQLHRSDNSNLLPKSGNEQPLGGTIVVRPCFTMID
jgi:hypothetical protein